MSKTAQVNILLVLLMVVTIFIAYFYTTNKKDFQRISTNLMTSSKFPKAEISYLRKLDAYTDIYNIKYFVPSPKNTYLVVYVAPIINPDAHQDSWLEVKQIYLNGSSGNVEVEVSKNYFNKYKYWLMVNVNSSEGDKEYNCTGNPTYTNLELSVLGISSCGDKSYLEISKY